MAGGQGWGGRPRGARPPPAALAIISPAAATPAAAPPAAAMPTPAPPRATMPPTAPPPVPAAVPPVTARAQIGETVAILEGRLLKMLVFFRALGFCRLRVGPGRLERLGVGWGRRQLWRRQKQPGETKPGQRVPTRERGAALAAENISQEVLSPLHERTSGRCGKFPASTVGDPFGFLHRAK